MKLGVVIICYNISSEVFLLQVAALKKFCKDDFTIEVVDNSSHNDLAEQIRYHSAIIGVDYIRTNSSSINSSDSHSFAANLAYHRFKNKYDLLFFTDHDCIAVCEFSAVEILKGGHVLAGIGQGAKKKYIWPGCLFICVAALDDKDIIDFSPNAEYGLDTGGNLWKAIEKYGQETCVFFNEAYHQNPDFVSSELGHYAMINNGMFMHFIAGSNWSNQKDHQKRISSLINVAKEKTGL